MSWPPRVSIKEIHIQQKRAGASPGLQLTGLALGTSRLVGWEGHESGLDVRPTGRRTFVGSTSAGETRRFSGGTEPSISWEGLGCSLRLY